MPKTYDVTDLERIREALNLVLERIEQGRTIPQRERSQMQVVSCLLQLAILARLDEISESMQ